MKKLTKEVYVGKINIPHGRIAYSELMDKIKKVAKRGDCSIVYITQDEYNGEVEMSFYSLLEEADKEYFDRVRASPEYQQFLKLEQQFKEHESA